jgi:hypothetical protein
MGLCVACDYHERSIGGLRRVLDAAANDPPAMGSGVLHIIPAAGLPQAQVRLMGRGQGQTMQAAGGLRRADPTDWAEDVLGMPMEEVFLSGEIADFVRGRDRWPSAQEWEDAGQHRVYVEMMRAGGPRRRLEIARVPYRPNADDVRRETVRVQLARFFDGRDQWPEEAAFAAAGQQRLHALLVKAGGEDLWAEIFGFPTREERDLLALMGVAAERRRVRIRR